MKVHTMVIIDIASGKIEYDECYEYIGEIAECKGGSSSSSKPLGLDDFLKSGPYSWLQDYYGDVNAEYDPMDQLTNYLATQEGNADILQNELTGDNGAVEQQRNILANLQTPEMMKASMAPYLSQAYANIGNAGAPSSSYADKLITSGVTQGWLDNVNKTLSGYGNLTGQTKDLTSALSDNASNVYDMTTEPLQLIKQIQLGRYGQNVTKSGSGKSGFSLGF
jgi:hypothetical protein